MLQHLTSPSRCFLCWKEDSHTETKKKSSAQRYAKIFTFWCYLVAHINHFLRIYIANALATIKSSFLFGLQLFSEIFLIFEMYSCDLWDALRVCNALSTVEEVLIEKWKIVIEMKIFLKKFKQNRSEWRLILNKILLK